MSVKVKEGLSRIGCINFVNAGCLEKLRNRSRRPSGSMSPSTNKKFVTVIKLTYILC